VHEVELLCPSVLPQLLHPTHPVMLRQNLVQNLCTRMKRLAEKASMASFDAGKLLDDSLMGSLLANLEPIEHSLLPTPFQTRHQSIPRRRKAVVARLTLPGYR
jgi:hypothetical protein